MTRTCEETEGGKGGLSWLDSGRERGRESSTEEQLAHRTWNACASAVKIANNASHRQINKESNLKRAARAVQEGGGREEDRGRGDRSLLH